MAPLKELDLVNENLHLNYFVHLTYKIFSPLKVRIFFIKEKNKTIEIKLKKIPQS